MKVPCILASQENTIMRSLQQKAALYSSSMKKITIITMFYLPPTFAAVSRILNSFSELARFLMLVHYF